MKRTYEILNDRIVEIDSYIDLISELEKALKQGLPTIGSDKSSDFYKVTVLQQKILAAGIFLHLYNLVEAIVNNAVRELVDILIKECGSAKELSLELQKQWIKSIAHTHKELTPDNRLKKTMDLIDQLNGKSPLKFEINKGGGGNWDDDEIEKLSKEIGVEFKIPTELYRKIKQPIRDDKGPLKVVKDFRNCLAHGEISFSECGEGHSVNDLRNIYELVVRYLQAMLDSFGCYLANGRYKVSTN